MFHKRTAYAVAGGRICTPHQVETSSAHPFFRERHSFISYFLSYGNVDLMSMPFMMKLNGIQPSQLYISSEKLSEVTSLMSCKDLGCIHHDMFARAR